MTSQEIYDNFVWKEFIVGDLFDIQTGKNIPNDKITNGAIPVVKATTFNNGVDGLSDYIENQPIFENKITVASHGAPGYSYYHDYIFMTSNNVLILSPVGFELNKYIGVFICTCIEKLKTKYSYGKVLGKERLQNEKIWLPVDENNLPNYQFMEDYIKSLVQINYNDLIESLK